jgi:hypothetical protein
MPTPQAPIASDFDLSSTAAEAIRGHDLHGLTAIVTGGSAGIGLETTRRSLVSRAQNMKTVEQGAATTVWAAVSHPLDTLGGVYCENCNIAEPVPADSQETRGVRPWATDPVLAERLWTLSERITGLKIA